MEGNHTKPQVNGQNSARRPAWIRYGVAIASVALGGLAREALTPGVGPTALPFIFFFPAVAIAAWFGGLGPGLFAIVLSALAANWFFTAPIRAFSYYSIYDVLSLAAFLLAALLIVSAIEAMHRAQARLVDEIAERKRVQLELAKAHDLLSTTVASIGDAVIITDEKGNLTSLNAEAERLTGWKNSEAAGHPLAKVFQIINEKTRQPAESPVEKVFRTGKIAGLANHTLLVSKEGREIPIDDSAAPIREFGGPLVGVVLVFRDVTEQRKAQQAAERLAAIIEHSGDAIITKNLDGMIQTWNPSAERLFGYQEKEIVGKHVTVLFPPDRLNEEDHIIGRLRQGQPIERLQTIRVAKSGRHIPVAVSVSPLKDTDGEIIGASKIVHDISDIIAAREALVREKESLETTVTQRTAKLRDTIDELEHFSYSITHDMRAPLRAMQGFGELLELESGAQLNDRGRDFVRRIRSSAERMDALIRDALNYSKIAREQFELVPVNPTVLLHGIVESYPEFESHRSKIEIQDNIPTVLGNQAAMTQCFSNLLGNAIKFVRPNTAPQIRVWGESRDGFVRLWFEDNGIGIPVEHHDRIFKMFQRLNGHREGTGIGLAIVRKAIERQGGKVGLESEPGEGSRFWVELKKAE